MANRFPKNTEKEEMKATKEDQLVAEVIALVTDLVKAIVGNPDDVQIAHAVAGNLIAISIRPRKDDVGRLLGGGGKHFHALETLTNEWAKIGGMEAQITLDETGTPPPTSADKKFRLGPQRNFGPVKELLERVVAPFIDHPSGAKITQTDLGTDVITSLMGIRVKDSDYRSVSGVMTKFPAGEEGHIIRAIKNLWDGIGKNHGRIVRVTLVNEG